MSLNLLGAVPASESAAAVRNRDPGAWDRLVSDQHKRLYNLHLRLTGDRETAADLTQETFTTAWEAADRFAGAACPETWLYGVALNCHRNWRRRTGRREPPDTLDDSLPDPTPTPEDIVALRQDTERLYGAVASLPEAYRRAVALRYFAGATAVEIAATEGVDPGTVRWRLHQAMKQLWRLLQPQAGKEQDNGPAAPGRVHLAP
jgi:RNA polymerase sigma-70 factor (ECF subfamily)